MTPWTVARQAPLSMGILQARVLEWVAMPFSRRSSQPRNRTQVSHIAGRFFTIWATRPSICPIFLYEMKVLTLFNPGHGRSNDLTLFVIFWHLVEGWEIAGLWKEMKFWSLFIWDRNKDHKIQTVRTIWVQATGQCFCYMQSSLHSLLCPLHRE